MELPIVEKVDETIFNYTSDDEEDLEVSQEDLEEEKPFESVLVSDILGTTPQ